MTVLERFIKTNNGDWIGGEADQCTIYIKKIQSRFNPEYSRFHVIFKGPSAEIFKRNVSLKSFAERRDAEIFATRFVALLNEDNDHELDN